MRSDRAWTYILADRRDGMLFTGATPDLVRRVAMHRQGIASHFTRRHKVTRLVWYEPHSSLTQASLRRDIIRHCRRRWKLNLVDASNPEWLDLFDLLSMLPDIPQLPSPMPGPRPCCAATS
ncbi:MAG: GIY-YIG nuclease family protein [Alphaproteobacteria bacterium]|nr:GIY-YIG nuclease family protein [Alphaproteobacteria bacterium]